MLQYFLWHAVQHRIQGLEAQPLLLVPEVLQPVAHIGCKLLQLCFWPVGQILLVLLGRRRFLIVFSEVQQAIRRWRVAAILLGTLRVHCLMSSPCEAYNILHVFLPML